MIPELGGLGWGCWGRAMGALGGGPHHAVQLVLQLLVDPLQRHVIALNPRTGGNGVTAVSGLTLLWPLRHTAHGAGQG